MSIGYVAILILVTIIGALMWNNMRRKNLDKVLSVEDTCFASEHKCRNGLCVGACNCGPDPHGLEESLIQKCYKRNDIV